MKTYIIAEAGVNHNGDIDIAKKLIDAAKAAGADAVKFQTFVAENVVSKQAQKADYQKKTTGASESQLDMVKKLSLTFGQFKKLKEYCTLKEIIFLSTPFDLESIDFLAELGMPLWKIPSGEITNLPYLIKIAKTGKPIILSTGMCEIHEISEALHLLRKNGCGAVTLLHCNTEYPTPFEDANILAINDLQKNFGKESKSEFDCEIGYSDHTLGIEAPIAAVALGATIIEKHFTLDKTMGGPDHKASLEPQELKAMVQAIRNIEKALGDGKKKTSQSELKNKNIARKSIVAKVNIKKGEVFSEGNITTKRPGTGVSPMKWFDVIGQVATRNFDEDELIEI